MQRHQVQQLFDFSWIQEMTTDVEEEATPWESRSVLNLQAGNCPLDAGHWFRSEDIGWQQLKQCLHTIKQTSRFRGANDYCACRDGNRVAFGAERGFWVASC